MCELGTVCSQADKVRFREARIQNVQVCIKLNIYRLAQKLQS